VAVAAVGALRLLCAWRCACVQLLVVLVHTHSPISLAKPEAMTASESALGPGGTGAIACRVCWVCVCGREGGAEVVWV
jgi:hypothetical protein